ncbi:MAG: iron-sulfur cluster repair di-iron protein [Acidobacteriota bacterium]
MSHHARAELLRQPLADIVTHDARTAEIFERANLDYCCHGQDTLEDAAVSRGIPIEALLTSLETLGPPPAATDSGATREALDDLTAHVVTHHHGYVRRMTPIIEQWLAKLADHHGARHAELHEVRSIFRTLAEDLAAHMTKEEHILFPYIDSLAVAARSGGRLPPSPFGTILNPIRMMEEDHREAGDGLTHLRRLTLDYTPPSHACTTYRLCYEELGRYESDLHRHVHLENNILFPRAIDLERRLA